MINVPRLMHARSRYQMDRLAATVLLLFLVCLLLIPGRASAFETISREKLDVLLQANQGKVTIVAYWTTWCSSCRDEIPELKKIRDAYSKDELDLIGISLDTNTSQLKAFIKMADFNYDIYQVPEENMSQFSEIDSLPTLVFYKKNGKKGWTHRGYMGPEEVRKTIGMFARTQ